MMRALFYAWTVGLRWPVAAAACFCWQQRLLAGKSSYDECTVRDAGYWATFQSTLLVNGKPVPGDAIWAKLEPCVPGYNGTVAAAGGGNVSRQRRMRRRWHRRLHS